MRTENNKIYFVFSFFLLPLRYGVAIGCDILRFSSYHYILLIEIY